MSNSHRRLEALERGSQAKREQVIYSDGLEYGLEPIPGGWVIFLYDGQASKALPRELWDAWPT